MNQNNGTPDQITRVAAMRTEMELNADNKREIRSRESSFGAFVVYAWGAVGLFALSVASVSLFDPFKGGTETAFVAGLESQSSQKAVAESNPITTASVKKTPTNTSVSPQQLVNIYPRSFKPQNKPFSFGAQVGSPTDIDGLVALYTVLEERSPQLLAKLNPLVKFEGQQSDIKARLIAGPFENKKASTSFCEEIRSTVLLDCRETGYEGDPLLAD